MSGAFDAAVSGTSVELVAASIDMPSIPLWRLYNKTTHRVRSHSCHNVFNITPAFANAGSTKVKGHIYRTPSPDHNADSAARRQKLHRHIGSSTVSMTWITPFDCITLAMVTCATSPLASVMVSLPGPASLTMRSSPATVLSLAMPSPALMAFIRPAAVIWPGTTW